jgi:hypothetical protein
MLHRHRILADQEVPQICDGRHHGARLSFERRFAPADDARVGLDLYEHVGPVARFIDRDPQRLDARNLQPSCCAGQRRLICLCQEGLLAAAGGGVPRPRQTARHAGQDGTLHEVAPIHIGISIAFMRSGGRRRRSKARSPEQF